MTHTPDACQVRQPSSATFCAHLASSPSASGSKSKVVCCHPSMVAEAMRTIRRTTGVRVHLAATPAWDSGLAYSRTNRSKTPAACLAGLVVEHMSVDTQGDGRVGVPEPAGHNMHWHTCLEQQCGVEVAKRLSDWRLAGSATPRPSAYGPQRVRKKSSCSRSSPTLANASSQVSATAPTTTVAGRHAGAVPLVLRHVAHHEANNLGVGRSPAAWVTNYDTSAQATSPT